MEYQAVWRGVVLARSADTIVVEGNRYFPAESVWAEFLETSRSRTICPWKGIASYYSITVDGVTNRDCAWYYPHPSFLAQKTKGLVAFWMGVCIEPVPTTA
jgi:uncharacterized protein (DUF427 family)